MSETPRDTDCPRTDKFQQGRPFAPAGDAMDWPTFARQLERDLAAANARAEQNEKDAGRYRWILKQAQITDFIFRVLNSKERHVSNAIDAAIAAKEKQ